MQLKIEDASRRLRTGDLGIPVNPDERFDLHISLTFTIYHSYLFAWKHIFVIQKTEFWRIWDLEIINFLRFPTHQKNDLNLYFIFFIQWWYLCLVDQDRKFGDVCYIY